MSWQTDTINPAVTSPAVDINKITNDLQVLRDTFAGTPDPDVPVNAAALGAVALTGNQTIAGNKTFTGNTSYTGTLTGGTGVINIGSGQLYKDASGNVGIGTSAPINSARLTAVGTTSINTTGLLGSQGTLALSAPLNNADNQCGIFMSASRSTNATTAGTLHVEPAAIDFRGNLVATYMADNSGGNFIVRQFHPSDQATYERMRIDGAGKILAAAGTNWVGTVSQNGQSSIIERGSNANGEFVKYADGTMICTGSVTESRSTIGVVQTNWTMPSAFLSVTSYVPQVHPATSRPDIVTGVTPLRSSATVLEVHVERTNTTNTTIYVQAIGRWY
jgi:hypothetical protein